VSSDFLRGSGTFVERMFNAIRDEWGRNRSKALKVATKVSGLSRGDLAERIENEPELVPLLTRLLWEAAMTGQGPLLELWARRSVLPCRSLAGQLSTSWFLAACAIFSGGWSE
jgi:hypothetical protein